MTRTHLSSAYGVADGLLAAVVSAARVATREAACSTAPVFANSGYQATPLVVTVTVGCESGTITATSDPIPVTGP